MFENPRRGRQARKLTTNVPKILDLKSSSEQIFFENWRWVPLIPRETDYTKWGFCFSGRHVPNGNSCSISWQPSQVPISGFRDRLSEKWNWFVQIAHAIPGRNVPIVTNSRFLLTIYPNRNRLVCRCKQQTTFAYSCVRLKLSLKVLYLKHSH